MVLTPFRLCLRLRREFDILLLMPICDLNINKEVVFAAVVITVYVDPCWVNVIVSKSMRWVDCFTFQNFMKGFYSHSMVPN